MTMLFYVVQYTMLTDHIYSHVLTMMDATKWTSEARTSQLCKPLSAVLRDTSSLSMLEYFIQFMESVGSLHLVQFWLSVESFKSAGHGTSHSRDCELCDNTRYGNTPISTGLRKPMYSPQSPNTIRNDMSISGYLTEHSQPTDEQPTTSHKEFGFTTSQSLGTCVHLDIGNHAPDESGCVSKNDCHSSGNTDSTGVGDLVQVKSQSSSAPQSVCLAEKGLSRQKSLSKELLTSWLHLYYKLNITMHICIQTAANVLVCAKKSNKMALEQQ